MSEKREVSVKAVMDIAQVTGYLESLLDGIKAGSVCVQRGSDEFVTLKPSKRVEIEVEATQKKGKETFTLELSWRRGEVEEPKPALKISSQEPEAAVEQTPAAQ